MYSFKNIILLLFIASNIWAQDITYLIFDEPCNDSLPVHFRKSNGSFKINPDVFPDTSGLSSLNASGSAEFCSQSLEALIKNINHPKILIMDLRQESHGFVNGLPISWYGKYDWGNVGLTRAQVEADESRRLDSLSKVKNIIVTQILEKNKATNEITKSKQIELIADEVQTEEELTKQYKLGYFRITATDHRQPVNEDVHRFVSLVVSMDKDLWLHFHCHAGDGRTTTFLSMYDMMRNAKSVNLDNILQRQYLLGGINLAKTDDFPDFDREYAVGRAKFLNDFYDYCRTNSDNFKMSYSEWLRTK